MHKHTHQQIQTHTYVQTHVHKCNQVFTVSMQNKITENIQELNQYAVVNTYKYTRARSISNPGAYFVLLLSRDKYCSHSHTEFTTNTFYYAKLKQHLYTLVLNVAPFDQIWLLLGLVCCTALPHAGMSG